jgi:16S rRNA (guanine527-N7)-methyltransferase
VPSAVKAFDVADLGSGADFPGIPIKLWAPEISMTLIESNHKKSTFLREVVRALKLTDVDVTNDRAETITDAFDLVTLRAVERFSQMLPTAARLTEPGGSLAFLIGSAQLEGPRETLPAFSWDDPIPIPLSSSRVLVLGRRT